MALLAAPPLATGRGAAHRSRGGGEKGAEGRLGGGELLTGMLLPPPPPAMNSTRLEGVAPREAENPEGAFAATMYPSALLQLLTITEANALAPPE